MENLEQKIKELLGSEIYILNVHENIRNSYVRITVDKDEPVTIDMTSEISKMIQESAILDEFYPDGVRLEVSSPGIGSQLEYPFQYKKNVGREISIQYKEDDNLRKIKGILEEASKDDIHVDCNRDLLKIRYEDIQKAKIVVSFN
jgi:ribosome maturation factor RimP